jgi:hypothetical protein
MGIEKEEYEKVKYKNMAKVKELRELLNKLDGELEVVIYPKYSSDEVDGFKKHTFRIDQVCEQEPYAVSIKNNPQAMADYFGDRELKDYEINEHIAILF